ncbi:hypothetical protein AWQ21_07275 [Picosynechococcus sp. PCC 7003]|nr:hypothetical protein AWQ21_07275 [Picosynechococcus sp. PCC 7003]
MGEKPRDGEKVSFFVTKNLETDAGRKLQSRQDSRDCLILKNVNLMDQEISRSSNTIVLVISHLCVGV